MGKTEFVFGGSPNIYYCSFVSVVIAKRLSKGFIVRPKTYSAKIVIFSRIVKHFICFISLNEV